MAEGNGADMRTMEQLAKTLSVISERQKLAELAGVQFEGARSLYNILGYKKSLSFEDYWQMYDREGIANRIVNAPARATWRSPPKFILDEDEPTKDNRTITRFRREWKKLDKRLQISGAFERADRLAGIGRYSVILIGTKGGSNLESEIRNGRSQDDVIYVSVFSENNAKIHNVVKDKGNERFGLPEFYNIKLMATDGQFNSGDIPNTSAEIRNPTKVHWSRCIHVAEDTLENKIFGEPRLRKVFNYLYDLQKTVGGSAEMFWILANRGMQMNIDADATIDPVDLAKLEDEMEEYFHGLRRWIRTQGVETKSLGSEAADPRGVFSSVIQLIAGSTGIPQRILLGSERGQLASEQDRHNWSERIKERQDTFGENSVLRPFVERLMLHKYLPALPDTWGLVWPLLDVLTDLERSTEAQRMAQASKMISEQNGENIVMSKEEFRTTYLDLGAEVEGTDKVEAPQPALPAPVDNGDDGSDDVPTNSPQG